MSLVPCQARPPWLRQLPREAVESLLENVLSRAIETSDEAALKLLGRWGVGVLACLNTDSRGLGALHVAVVFRRYDTLTALLSSKVIDVNQPSTNAAKRGWTALHFAAFLVDLRAIETLLLYGCDTSVVTQLQSTPLHFVTGRFGNRGDHMSCLVRTVMKTLIKAGVDRTATNSYGYTVMHESILWSDVTSLGVMLDQSTAQYFDRLLFIGRAILPHELSWRSPTLPLTYKKCLERAYFSQKMMKESIGVNPQFTSHDFHIYECLDHISSPSPTTVMRKGFSNPECLTAGDVGSLLRSAPPNFIIEVLKFQRSVHEYWHYSFREKRYVFPAYFHTVTPEWVCAGCRDCGIVAGRWLEMATKNEATNFLLQLMVKVLSNVSFSESANVDGNAAYFCMADQIQMRIQCVDRVRSIGVMIQVCSKSCQPEIVAECQSLLNFVLDLAYELKPNTGPIAVVSSRDLRAGKKIPHLFSLTDVNQARASHKSFLVNPACLKQAETFSDLLLSDPLLQKDEECDGTQNGVHKTTYYQCGDVWKEHVYQKAISSHMDDLTKLMDADVVADCLVLEDILSLSDARDVTSAEDKCACLLEKIADRNAYRHFFAVLQQTELPAHDRLFDILTDACKEISSGSLSDSASVYLEEHMGHIPRLPAVPEECSVAEGYGVPEGCSVPVTLHPALSGRLTEESGYGTHNSAQTHDRLTQISSRCTSQGSMDQVVSHMSMRDEFMFEHESRTLAGLGEESAIEDQLETDSAIAVSVLRRTNSIPRSSTPISVPTRNSSSSSLTSRMEQTAAAANTSPPASPLSPKHLSKETEQRHGFWWRLVEYFAPSPADNVHQDTVKVLPGVKIVF